MATLKLAVPSNNPGGLDAAPGMHFGHCDFYTIVEIEKGKVDSVMIVENTGHEQGGCLAPVQQLAAKGVQAMLAGGMGMRPLMGFQQMGIDVYRASDFASVKEAVDAFIKGELPRFSTDFTCKGCH